MAAVVRSLNTRQTLQRTHRNSPEIRTNAATTTHRISPWTHINVPHKSIRPVSIVGPTYSLTTSSASTWIFNKAGASSPQHSTGRQNDPTTLHNPPPTPPHLCARAARRAPMRRSCRTQHTCNATNYPTTASTSSEQPFNGRSRNSAEPYAASK